ncbi:hypothetical protein J4H64_18175 [Vibrio alginolyticus]|nr:MULTISPECIES: hypothetical protein [Vibrio harveyi group]ELP3328916.1 hypothetical protein [Vibrio alginolyticus]MBS9907705.1 hypothetical protein [Vibrio alginolyticus]MBS9948343.1 hypothetical protein [Vibrio alginolyticus]MBS9985489.1 hypothetical protein [Vibrio alginolyticus]MCS0323619.1 hypothetical protein [Vibrio diabolicus]
MSNKIIDLINVSNNKKISREKKSNSQKSKLDLLQRITSGQSGVVLEVLF